jgi:tyrosinase
VAATIYGQQVIVPGDPTASALIKTLIGLAPFDGSRFPRMPTGGPYVNDADNAFIEQWIRDGAPANNPSIE